MKDLILRIQELSQVENEILRSSAHQNDILYLDHVDLEN